MNGPSLTEIVTRWADRAAQAAAEGAVCEENLRALLGSQFAPERAWKQAHDGYCALLDRFERSQTPTVLKLVVPLAPTDELALHPPAAARIEHDLDLNTPPSLVVHTPVVRRDWEPVGEYRRPFPEPVFVDESGVALAEGLYIAFRAYRRQLLFERVRE